jgi:hypothetical protein
MAVATRGGSSIQSQALRLARLVKKFTAAGAMAYGVSAPGAAALTLMADIIIALDALGAFRGQGGSFGENLPLTLEADQAAFLGMTRAQMAELLTTV